MERGDVFRIRRRHLLWSWAFLLLLLALTLVGPALLAFEGQHYPNLDSLLFPYLLAGFIFALWWTYCYRLTTSIKLMEDYFILKKFGHRPARYPYMAILGRNERYELGRGRPFNELTVYLADNWFAIRSNEFIDYDPLKDYFTQYGQPVPYRTVFTLTERNRFRWLIGGLALLIGAAIAFGFVAHNPADPTPARMVSITGTVSDIRENKHRGTLKGVTIGLRAFPSFLFYVSRRNYDVRLGTLASALTLSQPVTLLIWQSDFRKKLRKTEPLTFGDKYVDYNQIIAFGVNQGDSVDILTPSSVFEPTHTNPLLRTILLSFLLLLCWTGLVYTGRQTVLRPG